MLNCCSTTVFEQLTHDVVQVCWYCCESVLLTSIHLAEAQHITCNGTIAISARTCYSVYALMAVSLILPLNNITTKLAQYVATVHIADMRAKSAQCRSMQRSNLGKQNSAGAICSAWHQSIVHSLTTYLYFRSKSKMISA
jgi:hypothetical protein